MNGDPTYDDLLSANKKLKHRLERLEENFRLNQTDGMRIKSRFLSNVSHEIRTPMNAILGFSGLLQNEEVSESEMEEYIFYITHNSHALLKVMDNIIDLTLLETENLKLHQERVDVPDLIEKVYDYHNSEMVRAEGDRVAILMSIPDNDLPVYVKADSYRLRRVIDNLMTCILKHQKKGVVEMKLDPPDGDRVTFSFNCEGNESLCEIANKIFENYECEDDTQSQFDNNTSVACKLAHDLVEAMGGEIRLNNSSIGNRLEIKIKLPAYRVVEEMKGAGMEMDVDEIPA